MILLNIFARFRAIARGPSSCCHPACSHRKSWPNEDCFRLGYLHSTSSAAVTACVAGASRTTSWHAARFTPVVLASEFNSSFTATGTLVNQHDKPVLVQLSNQQPFQMTLLANFSSQRDLPDTFTYNSYNNSITMFRRPEALDLPTLITYSLPSMACMSIPAPE